MQASAICLHSLLHKAVQAPNLAILIARSKKYRPILTTGAAAAGLCGPTTTESSTSLDSFHLVGSAKPLSHLNTASMTKPSPQIKAGQASHYHTTKEKILWPCLVRGLDYVCSLRDGNAEVPHVNRVL